jgi:hypothetical protein
MAFQRDYILRVIEQAGQMLIALRNRILGRALSDSQIEEELQSVARTTGFDLDLARSASPDTLLMIVAPTGEVEPGRCWVMAETLYLDGLRSLLEERQSDAEASLDKALRLFRLLEPGGAYLTGFPEAAVRCDEIEARLRDLNEPGPASGS